jgi:hypothetical protein
MATFDAILIPAQKAPIKIAGLAASTSTVEQAFGVNEIIAINSDQDITIRFGQPGLAASDATFFRIPANTTPVFDLGRAWPSIRLFNLSTTTAANIYIQAMAKG